MTGRRQYWILSIVLCVTVLGGCRTLKIGRSVQGGYPVVFSTGSYAMNESLPDSLVEAWQYNAEAGFGFVTPLLYGDYIVVANRRGEVHAVEAESGKKVGSKKFGDAINGTPALRRNHLYIPVDFGGKKGVRAWDLTNGSRVFDLRTPSVESDILIFGQRILFVDSRSTVYCVDGESGTELWRVQLNEQVPVAASPILVADDRVVVVNARGEAVVIDATNGSVANRFSVDGAVRAALSSVQDQVFIPTTSGTLFQFDVDAGTVRSILTVEDREVQLTPAAVNDVSVVVGASDGLVRSIDRRTGRVQWTADVGHPVVAPPFIAGSRIYVGTLGKTLIVLDASSGRLESRHALKGRVKSPLSGRAGELYVLAEPRILYRFS